VNPVLQYGYPVVVPIITFLFMRWLLKPEEVENKLTAAIEQIKRDMGKQADIDRLVKLNSELEDEMRRAAREFEDKLHEQERESWTKIGSLNELVVGLRGDIKYLQSRINGHQWKSQP